jgi:hypothetical protein
MRSLFYFHIYTHLLAANSAYAHTSRNCFYDRHDGYFNYHDGYDDRHNAVMIAMAVKMIARP